MPGGLASRVILELQPDETHACFCGEIASSASRAMEAHLSISPWAWPLLLAASDKPIICNDGLARCVYAVSESDLGDQLHLPRTHARARDLPEMTGPDQLVRQGKRGVIENIGSIRAEVELNPLRNRKYLVERHVHCIQARSIYDVSPHIAKCSRRRSRKGINVEP